VVEGFDWSAAVFDDLATFSKDLCRELDVGGWL